MNTFQFKVISMISCVVILFATSCLVLLPARGQCNIDNLLISTSDLPGDQWEEIGSRSYRDAPLRLGNERIGTGFSTLYGSVAGENVYRFRDETEAVDGYIDIADLWHRLESKGTKWSKLDLPSDLLISANEYRIECSVSSHQDVKTCWFIARYKNTVIEFRTAMVNVKEGEFFNILLILDQKAVTCSDS